MANFNLKMIDGGMGKSRLGVIALGSNPGQRW